MSYILDALRRADAERERGRVPGIHAHAAPGAADEAAPRHAPAPWRWIALGLGLLLTLGIGWWLGHDGAAPAEPSAAAMNPPPPIPQAGPRPIEPRPLEAPPAGATPPPTAAAPRPAEPALPPIEQRPTAEAARRAAAAASRPLAAPANAATTAATPAAPAPAAAASAAGAGRIYGRHELPDDIRRQLPAVAIGGSIYSPTPANRFVIINGQVVHEGGEIGPEHVLEAIRLKSAVLRFKGYRYELLF